MRRKHALSIAALLKDIRAHRKMVVRTVQVQRAQINKYRKSIRDGRKIVKRGAPASLESVTMETMIQMTLRVIQDLKDMIPDLIQPLVQRIHANLRKLQDRMLLAGSHAAVHEHATIQPHAQ
jgi:threonine dehydratase